MVKRIVMGCILVVLFASMAIGLPGDTKIWKLTWQPNIETDLAGYKVYWSATDGGWTATAMLDVGKVTTQTLTGIVPSNRHLCVTAYDLSGNESSKSVTIFFDKDITSPAAVGGLVIQ